MDKNHVCKLPPGGPVDIPAFVRCSSCVGTSAAPDTEPARAMPRITTGSSTLCSRYPSASPAATATKCKPAQEKSTAVGKSSGSKAHGMQLNLGKLNGGTAQQSAVAASNTVPFSPRSWEVASYYYRFVQQSPRVYELAPRHDAHTSTPSSSALSDAPTPKKKLMGVLKATPDPSPETKRSLFGDHGVEVNIAIRRSLSPSKVETRSSYQSPGSDDLRSSYPSTASGDVHLRSQSPFKSGVLGLYHSNTSDKKYSSQSSIKSDECSAQRIYDSGYQLVHAPNHRPPSPILGHAVRRSQATPAHKNHSANHSGSQNLRSSFQSDEMVTKRSLFNSPSSTAQQTTQNTRALSQSFSADIPELYSSSSDWMYSTVSISHQSTARSNISHTYTARSTISHQPTASHSWQACSAAATTHCSNIDSIFNGQPVSLAPQQAFQNFTSPYGFEASGPRPAGRGVYPQTGAFAQPIHIPSQTHPYLPFNPYQLHQGAHLYGYGFPAAQVHFGGGGFTMPGLW